MPARTYPVNTFELFLTRLHETREVSVYEAIERLLQVREAAGLDASALIRLLDRGLTFEELFELIEGRLEFSRKQRQSLIEHRDSLHCEAAK